MSIIDGKKELMEFERGCIFNTVTKLSNTLSECEYMKEDIPAIAKTLETLMYCFCGYDENKRDLNSINSEVRIINKKLDIIFNDWIKRKNSGAATPE